MPTGPITVNIGGSTTTPGTTYQAGSSPMVCTGSGPCYTINPDGSTTWYDSLGNVITDISAYNAALAGSEDTGTADTGQAAVAASATGNANAYLLLGVIAIAGLFVGMAVAK